MLNLLVKGTTVLSNDPRNLLRPSDAQRMVKDEVVFAPAANPYAALERASQRLSEGKSVFGVCQENKQAPAK